MVDNGAAKGAFIIHYGSPVDFALYGREFTAKPSEIKKFPPDIAAQAAVGRVAGRNAYNRAVHQYPSNQ
jgi:hypothetical protein